MQLVTAQFLLPKWRLLASLLEASPAPLEASFRALVRQNEAMSSFGMERDALCASDRVSFQGSSQGGAQGVLAPPLSTRSASYI